MSDTKRKKLEAIFAKLQKLLPHLGNANVNEAAVALQKINNLLATVGLDWNDFVTLLHDTEPSLLSLLSKLFAKDEDVLVELGLAGAEFFHSDSTAFADVNIDGHRRTWPLSEFEFTDWLLLQFLVQMLRVPSSTAMKTAIRTLSAHAKFKGEQRDVHLRAAKFSGKIYLDVGDADWSVIEIDRTGWRMIDDSPVRFRRTQGMRPLPIPERGGSIDQLRPLVNLTGDGFVLFVSCILDALCPDRRPHSLLYLAGDEGSTKSTAAKIARSLIDPNEVPLRNLPTAVRDLFVSVNGSHAMVFDNVSSISHAVSDALCQITSGSGFGTRKNYTDIGQVLIGGYRPVILNGLQNAIDRSDLADRAVVVSMQRVNAEQRRSEIEIWNHFERDRAQIFGAFAAHLFNPRGANADREISIASFFSAQPVSRKSNSF